MNMLMFVIGIIYQDKQEIDLKIKRTKYDMF